MSVAIPNYKNARKREAHKFFKGACYYCGKQVPLWKSSVDHVYPLCLGSFADDPQNMVLSCRRCNGDKGDLLPDEWADLQRGEGFPGETFLPWQEILDWHEGLTAEPAPVTWTIGDAFKSLQGSLP